MSGQTSKRCPSPLHVGERVLPIEAFGLGKDTKSGRKSHCRACISAKYRLDPSKQKARSQRYAEANRDKIVQRSRDWRAANREKHRAYAKAWAQANPDRVRENIRRWTDQNRDHVNAQSRIRMRSRRAYYRAAFIRYQARKKGNGGECTAEQLAARWAYYAGRCWMCGADAKEWDHVKPVSKGGCSWPSNLRPACQPCNRRKSGRWPL